MRSCVALEMKWEGGEGADIAGRWRHNGFECRRFIFHYLKNKKWWYKDRRRIVVLTFKFLNLQFSSPFLTPQSLVQTRPPTAAATDKALRHPAPSHYTFHYILYTDLLIYYIFLKTINFSFTYLIIPLYEKMEIPGAFAPIEGNMPAVLWTR